MQLLLFAESGVAQAALFLLAAAPVLWYTRYTRRFAPAADGPRYGAVAATVCVVILLVMALKIAVPALLNARRQVALLRSGIVATGRISSCRFSWQKAHDEKQYAEFLRTWPLAFEVHAGRAIGTGCGGIVLLGMLLVPVMIASVTTGAAPGDLFVRLPELLAIMWRRAQDDPEPFYWAGAVVVGIVGLGVLVRSASRFLQRRQLEQKLAALKTPQLPPDTLRGVWLRCLVEYRTQEGESRRGSGFVRFNSRLDVAGNEVLVYAPDDPGSVVLLGGLPEALPIGSDGQLGPVSPLQPAAVLTASALLWVAVLWLFLRTLSTLRVFTGG